MAQVESISILELEMDLKNIMGISTASGGLMHLPQPDPPTLSSKSDNGTSSQISACAGEAALGQSTYQQPLHATPSKTGQVDQASRTCHSPPGIKKNDTGLKLQPMQIPTPHSTSVSNPRKKNKAKGKKKHNESPVNSPARTPPSPFKIETLVFSRSDLGKSLEERDSVKYPPLQKNHCEPVKHSEDKSSPKREDKCQKDFRQERKNADHQGNWRKDKRGEEHQSLQNKEKRENDSLGGFRIERKDSDCIGPWTRDKKEGGRGPGNRGMSWRDQGVLERSANVNSGGKKEPQGPDEPAIRKNWREAQVKPPPQGPPISSFPATAAEAACKASSPLVEQVHEEEMVRLVLFPPTSTPRNEKNKESSQSNSPVEDEDEDDDDSEDLDEEEEEEAPPPAPEETKKEIQPLIMLLPKKQLEWFKQNNIFTLKQMNLRFPRAFLHCRLCSFHMSSISEGKRHAASERHANFQRKEILRRTLALIPNPTAAMVDVMDQLVSDVYNRFSLSPEELELRRQATERLKVFVETNFPGTSIRSYGSCFTGLGLKTSTTNVGLCKTHPEVVTPPGLMIIYVLHALRQSTAWIDLREDLNTRVPTIHFRDARLNAIFSLGFDNENAFKTSCLLQQYLLLDRRFGVLTVVFRAVARICQLDQPDLGTLPPHAYSLMTLYYMQQEKYLPVLHHQTNADQEKDTFDTAAEFMEKNPNWKPSELSLGRLWMGLVKFYGHSFSYGDTVVSVRSLTRVSRSSKAWGNRRLAIEDPFHQSVNMASPVSTAASFDYYVDCIRQTHLYFWTPQIIGVGPLFIHLVPNNENGDLQQMTMTVSEAVRKTADIPAEQLKWLFLPEVFTGGSKLPVNCCVCLKENHTKLQCPELTVPQVGPIPPPDFAYLAQLDQLCFNIFRNFAPRDVELANRELIRRELEQHIQSKDYSDAKLTLFGSSCNGFGFADSDLDLCLTFESNPEGKELDLSAIVKQLAKRLRENKLFTEIVPIASAKVPIVKLRHRPTGLESDISLYNRLGQRNSELLATYSKIDTRVRILGFMAKILAKRCEIGDASRGSLSSYAYTLMVLHYLQQVKPPIIPVLQEIQVPGTDRSRYIVEGWDTWFFDDLSNLARVWPHVGGNQEPPSVLWLGFLLYYAELFDFRQQVVCIRQLRPLYRLEKMWTDRPIAIEDPFDLNHNLGAGVSPRMGAFIRRVFVYARRLFQTPVKRVPPGFSLEGHLFNPNLLRPNGPPPNDRGCRICGKVGHKAKECEFARRKGNKGNKNGRQQQQSAGQRNTANASRPPASKVRGTEREKNSGPRNFETRGSNMPR